jgi:hypothetical protein
MIRHWELYTIIFYELLFHTDDCWRLFDLCIFLARRFEGDIIETGSPV